nr:hypothetical protein CFP56_54035 [Quercus suber]
MEERITWFQESLSQISLTNRMLHEKLKSKRKKKIAFVGKSENHKSFNNQQIEVAETSVKYAALTAVKTVKDV